MELENYYRIFNNILPKTFCDEVVAYATGFSLNKGITFLEEKNPKAKKINRIRRSNVRFFNDPWIINELRPLVEISNKESNWNFEYSKNEDVQFTEYKKNQYYGFHADSSPVPFKKGNLTGLIRKLSMSVNLTDSNKYKGGEFVFKVPTGNGEYEEIVPEGFNKKGSVVIFPSFVIHTVKPVTKGKRHSLVMWTSGKPFQ
tara:strand:- start:413 stop:1012 length:600 start_codon:yes stop_codon:yes gene_type:complete